MHLTSRRSGWRFQIRISRDLEGVFDLSPLRLNPGPRGKRNAARTARLLAGHAESVFLACRKGARMTKDELIAELQAMLIGAMDVAERAQEAADHRRELEVKAVALKFAPERLAEQEEMDARLLAVGNGIDGLRDRISILPKDQRDAMGAQLAELSALVKQSLDSGPERPLLLDELDRWIELRAGHAAEKKSRTDRSRILDFVSFAGNRLVNRYRYSDFQAFANLLARVPANYSKEARLREMTRQEAADYNDGLPLARQFPLQAHQRRSTRFVWDQDRLRRPGHGRRRRKPRRSHRRASTPIWVMSQRQKPASDYPSRGAHEMQISKSHPG
ncbi:MAG: hypothetical protein J0I42_00940 [Bosea sp.]|uniref:hypothetical protein n=1 Tax=Bosea sp. (in: a-proteobacteria) TaxID=1871050 RepID=UPI001AC9EBE5|nr:hypothetical protein [Bosea sp. (in: a-proteobacteria)]MBN9450489.1 hypothetical protein [Bosea sp. (in: a-proteobacteria)]